MEGQPLTSSQNQHQYQSAQWSRLVRRNTFPRPVPGTSPTVSQPTPLLPLDFLPAILPQQSSLYQAQLTHYNNLISSRSKVRLHTPPLPPLLSPPGVVQAAPVSRSGSAPAIADRDRKPKDSLQRGHGNNKTVATSSQGEQTLITTKETPTMASKKSDVSKSGQQVPPRPPAHTQSSITTQQSSSVPSTPRQRARQFSLGSREPSPTLPQSHSPRSAYSESNSTLPSLRPPPPPRIAGCKYETAMAFSKRRMPYSIGSDWLEKIKPSSVKAKLTQEEEKTLTQNMRDLYERLLPSPESDAKRERFRQKLEKLLNDEWPGHDIRVHMFGSSGNMLCTDDSDVDICITTKWKELENVCMLAELLAKHGMEKVICVSTAKVPIVKIWDPELSFACDMNVNNTLAMENTRMIKTYVQIDERVRPLAMIIKHWTKKRIVNDAAFGGTLSSYTWICMIISFLQTRNPPILPALHQEPHLTNSKVEGKDNSFADNLDVLRGFGDSNKETLGELLFHFFRYYGFELDYEKLVVSVRSGKLIPKIEKGWHLGNNNNRLCVEEPFNTNRNLGNTADETSFRGLHTEIRRAFDLVSVAKMHEACEQYVFPKEEEKTFIRPAQQQQAKVVMTRSSSQSNRGRNSNYRGRHSHRNGNSNRRASSGTYDNPGFMPQALPPNLTHEAWQTAQTQLHNDLYATFSVLQAQENSLRLQLYTQSQAYAHAQAQAYAQVQRLQAGNGNGKQSFSDRDRGNSFDAPPLTAPIRPDMYFYPFQYPSASVYGQNSPTAYPSSPSMSPSVPELRRSLHRSTVTGGSGPQGVSTSSLRSHSQPAARSASASMSLQAPTSNPGGRTASGYQAVRHANGVSIPNFIADENLEIGNETNTQRTVESPPDEVGPKEYLGYFVNGSPTASQQRQSSITNGMVIPAFGDLPEGQSRRRQSAEQFPQAIFDRLRRSGSRSPSPLGHNRAFSSGVQSAPHTNKLQQSVSSGNLRAMNIQTPMVVNGSTFAPDPQEIMSQASAGDSSSYDDCGYPVPVDYADSVFRGEGLGLEIPQQAQFSNPTPPKENRAPRLNTAIVANGSNPEILSAPPVVTSELPVPKNRSPSKIELPERIPNHKAFAQQNGGMSPLDISNGQADRIRDDIAHLSPVYETRSPSPTANRKFEPGSVSKSTGGTTAKDAKDSRNEMLPLKIAVAQTMTAKQNGPARANGHVKAAKSEGSGLGNWQQITKSKKKGGHGDHQKHAGGNAGKAEQPPRNSADRKGG